MQPIIRLFCVRHGETKANVAGICQGQSESPLTKNGLHQATLVAKTLQNTVFLSAYSSDLSRAKDTCKEIVTQNIASIGLSITLDKRIREYGRGWMEGQPFEGAKRDQAIAEKANQEIETTEEVIKRGQSFLYDLMTPHTALPKQSLDTPTVLMVSHGHFLQTFFKEVLHLNIPQHWKVKNCSITVLDLVLSSDFDTKVTIQKLNDVCHLNQPL